MLRSKGTSKTTIATKLYTSCSHQAYTTAYTPTIQTVPPGKNQAGERPPSLTSTAILPSESLETTPCPTLGHRTRHARYTPIVPQLQPSCRNSTLCAIITSSVPLLWLLCRSGSFRAAITRPCPSSTSRASIAAFVPL